MAGALLDGLERALTLLLSADQEFEGELLDEADKIASLVRGQIHPSVALLDERMARMRTIKKILETGDWLTAEQINKLQLTPPKNPAHPASDWKRRGRIFSLLHGGKEYFARYQFDEAYQPLSIIKDILVTLGTIADPWKIAAWFHFPNGWIAEGQQAVAPKDALDRRADVLNAARKQHGSHVA